MLIDTLIKDNRDKEEKEVAIWEALIGETPSEVISENEIYLLKEVDDEKTGKKKLIRGTRICGRVRFVEGKKLRCRVTAGRGTNHVGWGVCYAHERQFSSSLKILKSYQKAGLALEISELLENKVTVLDDPAMYDISEEIIIVTHLLSKAVHDNFTDTDHILQLTANLSALKLARGRLENEKLTLNVNSVKLFVGGIFGALKKYVTPQQYSLICNAIKQEVVFPINASMQKMLGEVSGSEEDTPGTPDVNDVTDVPTKKRLPGSTLHSDDSGV